jgi:hypothetical protein
MVFVKLVFEVWQTLRPEQLDSVGVRLFLARNLGIVLWIVAPKSIRVVPSQHTEITHQL